MMNSLMKTIQSFPNLTPLVEPFFYLSIERQQGETQDEVNRQWRWMTDKKVTPMFICH